jgi:hypothetical protein
MIVLIAPQNVLVSVPVIMQAAANLVVSLLAIAAVAMVVDVLLILVRMNLADLLLRNQSHVVMKSEVNALNPVEISGVIMPINHLRQEIVMISKEVVKPEILFNALTVLSQRKELPRLDPMHRRSVEILVEVKGDQKADQRDVLSKDLIVQTDLHVLIDPKDPLLVSVLLIREQKDHHLLVVQMTDHKAIGHKEIVSKVTVHKAIAQEVQDQMIATNAMIAHKATALQDPLVKHQKEEVKVETRVEVQADQKDQKAAEATAVMQIKAAANLLAIWKAENQLVSLAAKHHNVFQRAKEPRKFSKII